MNRGTLIFVIVFTFLSIPTKADIFSDIKDGVEHLGKEINKEAIKGGKALEQGAQDIGKGADHLGKEINKEAIKGGKALEQGAQDVGKGAEHFVHEVGDVLDKTGREIGNAGRDINRWAIENKEDAIAIALLATVGWAACYDGCTFVGSLIAEGVAIPVVTSLPENDDSQDDNSRNEPTNEKPSKKEIEEHEKVVDDGSPKVEVFPYYKRDGKYDFRPPISVEKRDFGTVAMDAEVAMPTQNWEVRNDGAGYIFSSRGSSEMRRNHAGLDITAEVGTPIYATISGHIQRQQNPYKGFPELTGIRMVNEKGFASGIFYVELSSEVKKALAEGKKFPVTAGVTQIGIAQDPSVYPKNKGTPPHVHTYWEDPIGRKLSPDGHIAIAPKP